MVIGVVACLIAGASFYYFQYESNFETAVADVKKQIESKNGNLSKAIFYKNDKESFRAVMDNLLITLLSSYRVEKSSGETFLESKQESRVCKSPMYQRLILVDEGVFVGKVYFCISDIKLAKNTLASLPTLIVLLIILVIAVITPVVASDQYLRIMLKSTENPNEPLSEFSKRVKKLPSASREVLLKIRQKNDETIEASKLAVQLEKENRHKKVLEQAAHDIGNPVLGLLKKYRLKMDMEPNEVEDSLKKISLILEELKSDTKADHYKLNVIERVSVLSVINEIVEEKRILHPRIKFSVNGTDKTIVSVTEIDFYRVMLNLITNACEAVDEIRGPRVDVLVSESKGKAVIEVSDNGKGMSEEVKVNAFKWKYTQGKESGTGLGLNYVSNKMLEWGGRVSFDTNKNGTTFILNLNLASKDEDGNEKVV